MDFWLKTSGTWINVCMVSLGTILGLLLRSRLPSQMQLLVTQSLGLITLLLGFNMGSNLFKVRIGYVDGVILGLIALVMGGFIGEWCKLEENLKNFENWLKRKVKDSNNLIEGFITASLLFCIGPMSLIGSINNGLTGDNTLLTLKSIMDGIASIALASTLGIGVGFSALVILIYQGSLSLMASIFALSINDPTTNPQVILITGVGGLLLLAIAVNLLNICQVRIISFLPAFLLIPLLYIIASWI
jgi:uncharacterized membrane protein YqgA involved in biofilm formation